MTHDNTIIHRFESKAGQNVISFTFFKNDAVLLCARTSNHEFTVDLHMSGEQVKDLTSKLQSAIQEVHKKE